MECTLLHKNIAVLNFELDNDFFVTKINDVYNEKFLKPLMLSLEYEIREKTDKSFYSLDNTLHMDHILPRAYKQNDEWNYIKDEEVLPEINGLGNMALLQDIKNEEALNCGFDRKIRIYKRKKFWSNIL